LVLLFLCCSGPLPGLRVTVAGTSCGGAGELELELADDVAAAAAVAVVQQL
jgi:hypothetical protein